MDKLPLHEQFTTLSATSLIFWLEKFINTGCEKLVQLQLLLIITTFYYFFFLGVSSKSSAEMWSNQKQQGLCCLLGWKIKQVWIAIFYYFFLFNDCSKDERDKLEEVPFLQFFLIVSKKSLMMYTVASLTKPSPVGNNYVVKAFWHHGKPIKCNFNPV